MPNNTYNTEVNYYRINANNTNIAVSASGADGSPNEEIAPPTSSGGSGFLNKAGDVINGLGTSFNVFSPGQYVYFINNSGANVLLGQISSIGGPTALTLVAGSYTGQLPATGNIITASYSLITTTESFYIRVATEKTSNTLSSSEANIPLLTSWRLANNATSANQPSVTQIQQYSTVGTPTSIAPTPIQVQFTLEVMNQFPAFTGQTTSSRSWNSVDEIPDYIWLKAVVKGGTSSLSGQTMYRITTEETIDALVVTPGFSNQTLINSGYFNVTNTTTAGPGDVGGN